MKPIQFSSDQKYWHMRLTCFFVAQVWPVKEIFFKPLIAHFVVKINKPTSRKESCLEDKNKAFEGS